MPSQGPTTLVLVSHRKEKLDETIERILSDKTQKEKKNEEEAQRVIN